MPHTAEQLRDDAQRIWQAGVDAVRPDRLFRDHVRVEGGMLVAGDVALPLERFARITVVGAGKGGAGMVRGLEASLGDALLAAKQVSGLVTVPAGCVEATRAIGLVAGRPAGVNEPRAEGAAAANEILRRVGALGPDDLCLCLISGGGSALLPAPIDGVSLEEKTAVTRLLSASGATINQLNTVRSAISRIKGGGLARACNAGVLLTLIVSDVLGDPLEVIASGPTVPAKTGPAEALAVLADLGVLDAPAAAPIVARLQQLVAAGAAPAASAPTCEVHNVILANNAVAVDAAGVEAERLGYNHAMDCATTSEGPAEQVGRQLAAMALQMRDQPGPNCLITGGEPTVTLAPTKIRGRGGRNQQLALAALAELGDCRGVAILSGGTDGEDGPTDAAGAFIDQRVAAATREQGLDLADALRRNDAYTLFEACGGLLRTGPTNTNVCDLRVVVVDQSN
ncbi:MAG: DUF4147 domain-containing protein [Planctomycetota bacterium]